MSTDIYMACDKCKSAIDIGSEGMSGFKFYRGESKCMEALHAWLREHVLCDPMPRLATEHHVDIDDGWKHIDWRQEVEANE